MFFKNKKTEIFSFFYNSKNKLLILFTQKPVAQAGKTQKLSFLSEVQAISICTKFSFLSQKFDKNAAHIEAQAKVPVLKFFKSLIFHLVFPIK